MKTRDCLEIFLKNSKKDDILIFSLGFAYCEQESELIDYEAWLRASATAFRSNIQQLFHGKIFRINNAPALYFDKFQNFDQCLRKIDQNLYDIWHPSTFDDKSHWYSIDQFSINFGRPEYYNDGLHYQGPLSMATSQLILNNVCAEEGKTIKIPDLQKYPPKSLVFVNSTNSSEPILLYFVDSYGIFRKIRNATSICSSIIIHSNEITITESEFRLVEWIGEPFPTICEEHTLLALPFSKTIYVSLIDGTCRFNSQQAFISRGYDFSDVKHVNFNDFSLLKEGKVLYC